MNTTGPVVSVIIVNYNTREMTLQCLRALSAALQEVKAEVWLVDNASQDGSVAAIRGEFPSVQIIVNPVNAGFGAANNIAMCKAEGEFFLLLNSDAFMQPGALQALVEYLRCHPDVAVVGPRLLNADGTLQRSCYTFPSPARAWLENLWISGALPNHRIFGDYSRWNHDCEREVDFVIGACPLVRRAAYEQVGGFDEKFFMYSEETDWQRRMRDAGWKVGFTPAAEVTHLGGASGAGQKAKINRHFFDSLDWYERKHHGLAGLISLRMAMAAGSLLRLVAWSCVLIGVPRRRDTARAKLRLLSWLLLRQTTHWPRAGASRGA